MLWVGLPIFGRDSRLAVPEPLNREAVVSTSVPHRVAVNRNRRGRRVRGRRAVCASTCCRRRE
eukprot:10850417-Lingulodinium_polyedra.AAC.1